MKQYESEVPVPAEEFENISSSRKDDLLSNEFQDSPT